MSFYDGLTNGESHSGAIRTDVAGALKQIEYPIAFPFGDADTVVGNRDANSASVLLRRNRNYGRRLTPVFESVINQVLKQLHHLNEARLDYGQTGSDYCGPGGFDRLVQVLERGVQGMIQINFDAPYLAAGSSGIGEQFLDEGSHARSSRKNKVQKGNAVVIQLGAISLP